LSLTQFARRVAVALAILGLGVLIWQTIDVIVLVFAGGVLAIVLRSLAALAERHTPLRGVWALTAATLTLLFLLGAFGALIGWRIADQLGDLTQAVSHAWSELSGLLEHSPLGHLLLSRLTSSSAVTTGSSLTHAATGTIGALTDLVIILFVGLFLAADPDLYRRGLLALAPPSRRDKLVDVLDSVVTALERWLGGVVVSMLCVGVISGTGLWLLGVPLALSLGFLAGLLEFVPYVGPIASAVPAVLVAFASRPMLAVEVIGLYLLVHLIEGYILVPLIQKRAVALPPALGIIAVVIFGILFGPLGIIFAHPLMVTVIVLVRKLYVDRMTESAAAR
jgi:predicted PurR-regulated permease PerM